jgi:hypothetical protein
MEKLKILILTAFLLPCSAFAEDMQESTAVLGLKAPIKVDASHMYSDGGTLGLTFTDANKKELKLCYDGRQDERVKDRYKNFHVFIGVLYPTDQGAEKISICSAKEKAVLKIVADWVDKNYPKDWRDPNKWASTGYVKRLIDDLSNRACNKK